MLFIFKEFLPVTYKLGSIKTLIDGTFEINNTWMEFQTDLQKLFVILQKNLFPENLSNKNISKHIQTSVNGGKTQIAYTEHFSVTTEMDMQTC